MCLPRSRRRQRQLPGQRRTGTTSLSLVAVVARVYVVPTWRAFSPRYMEPLPRDHSPEPRTRQLGDAQTRARPDISRAGAGMRNRDDGPAGSNIDRQRGAEGSNRGRYRGQVKPRSGRERARCSVAGMVSPSRVVGACTLHTLRTWGADIPAGSRMYAIVADRLFVEKRRLRWDAGPFTGVEIRWKKLFLREGGDRSSGMRRRQCPRADRAIVRRAPRPFLRKRCPPAPQPHARMHCDPGNGAVTLQSATRTCGGPSSRFLPHPPFNIALVSSVGSQFGCQNSGGPKVTLGHGNCGRLCHMTWRCKRGSDSMMCVPTLAPRPSTIRHALRMCM